MVKTVGNTSVEENDSSLVAIGMYLSSYLTYSGP